MKLLGRPPAATSRLPRYSMPNALKGSGVEVRILNWYPAR